MRWSWDPVDEASLFTGVAGGVIGSDAGTNVASGKAVILLVRVRFFLVVILVLVR